MKILILNGSPQGDSGNCAALGRKLESVVASQGHHLCETVHLVRTSYGPGLSKKIFKADALIFVTGTYWDTWGSPLQKFFEQATELEVDPRLLGKPAAAIVLMHSVGGKGVLSRLQGVLSSFGFLIPPLTGLVHSLAAQLASAQKSAPAEDFWCLEDLAVIVQNLVLAAETKTDWKSWPVDRKNFRKNWLK